jgi:hypothetical protein
VGGLSRRTFLGVSAGGLSALYSERAALAALQGSGIVLSPSQSVDSSNALNFALFLENRDTLGLTGVMSTTAVEGALGSYAPGTLFLFPFERGASSQDMRAYLPTRDAVGALVSTAPMNPAGLPPDEYYLNYVLKAPRQSFIGFSVDAPSARGAENRPWQTNVDLGQSSVRIGWTSSNLNHPWFAGSHWIPDSEGDGRYWRARIIEGVRQASAMAYLS